MGNSNIFSLGQIYQKQIRDQNYVNIFDPFIFVTTAGGEPAPSPAYGYVAGGDSKSLNQRIDFNNDTSTTSTKGNFSTQVEMGGATGNRSYGYTMGGYDGSSWNGASKVYRIDYANDTGTPTTKGPLSAGRKYCNSIGNANYGYTGGGYIPGSIIDRLDYANDTATASSLGNIFSPGDRGYATAGNQSFGYFAGGGGNYPRVSTVSRLDYANDGAATSPKGPLIGVLDNGSGAGAGTGNVNFGYFQTNNGYLTTTQISRVDYGNDTATALSKGPLTANCYMRSATGSANYGYFSGGYQWPVFGFSTIDRIDYANDTATASPKGPLATGTRRTAGVSSQEHGFPAPTSPGPNASTSDRVVGPAYGYNAGGQAAAAGNMSLVQRLDFNSDTVTTSNKGNLPVYLSAHCGTTTGSYGYTFGGTMPGANSTTFRVDFGNDTAAAASKGYLYPGIHQVTQSAAIGNSNYGYIGGGGSYPQYILKFDFANDSNNATSLGTIMSPSAYAYQAVGYKDYGYFAGGLGSPSGYTSVRRVDYASDTGSTSPKGPLASTTSYCGATGNTNFGYFHIYDGYVSPYTTSLTTRIQYANDTATSLPKGYLINSQYGATTYTSATGNANFGYWFGGMQPNSDYSSLISRLDYASDTTTASPKGPLGQGLYSAAGFSGQQNQFSDPGKVVDHGSDGLYVTSSLGPAHGYWGGGAVYQGPGPGNYYPTISTMCRLDYANDTNGTTTKGPLAQAADEVRAVASKTHGYWTHGQLDSYIQRVDFANDTPTATNRGTITPRGNLYAVGNESYGYMSGGRWTSDPSGTYRQDRTERIDYANDNVAAATKGSLSSRSEEGGATGNANYGYFGGGYIYPAPNPASSKVDRLDYANDTTTATPKGSLSVGRFFVSATGNVNYGWFGGGFDQFPAPGNPNSVIDRIDYANDTAIASARGSLNYDRARAGATGSANYGYWAGGNDGSNSYTNIERVDYANDTGTASIRSNLPYTPGPAYGKQSNSGAASGQANGLISETTISSPRVRFIDGIEVGKGGTPGPVAGPSNGYVMGGYPAGCAVDRIDFANDTNTAVTKGDLCFPSYRGGGNGNMSFGYTFGGNSSSQVSRLDYANDTSAGSQRGNLYTPADYCATVGNNNYGYTGGRPWGNPSLLARVDYANDTVQETLLGTNLFVMPGYYGYGGVGNQNFGYYVGGTPSSSSVRSIDYSNDAVAVSPKGPLSATGRYACATGNANYGWVSVGPSYYHSAINRIDYANDTGQATPKGNLSVSSTFRSVTGDNNYGYWCGGTSPNVSTVSRVDFANDTATGVPKGPLSATRNHMSQGYSAKQNGNPQTPVPPTGTVQAPFPPPFQIPEPLPAPLLYPSAFGYGYAVAGPGASTVSRIDYSNDTATGVSKGPDDTSGLKASTSSETHGYLCGGYDPAPFSNTGITRTEYANDTAASTPKGNLATPSGLAMSGQGLHTPSYGWIWTTYPAGPLNRIDFANDTATAPNRQTTPATATRSGTTGNQTYAWKVGGSASGSSQTFTFRLEYANDTSAVSPKGNMDSLIDWPACFGNQNYGYFGGCPAEINPRTRTSTHRIDYANDTATSVQKGSSPIPFGLGAGTSHNDNYGFMGMGDSPSSWNSRIYRVDYANDTVAASPSGPVSFGPAYANGRSRMVSAADGGMTPGSPYS